MDDTIFRKKTMDRISSPEQLTDYLRVTNPGIWIFLSAVILLVAGLFVWASVGTLETTAGAKALVSKGDAVIALTGTDSAELSTGMTVRIASNEYIISDIYPDEYGRNVAFAEVSLPDGTYDASVVVEKIHPISFLFESR